MKTNAVDRETPTQCRDREACEAMWDVCRLALRMAEVEIKSVKVEYDESVPGNEAVGVNIDARITVSLNTITGLVLICDQNGCRLGLHRLTTWPWDEFLSWSGMAGDLEKVIAPKGWVALVEEWEGDVEGIEDLLVGVDETVTLARASYIQPDRIEIVLNMEVRA